MASLNLRERARSMHLWIPVTRKDAQPSCKCRRSTKWKSYRIRQRKKLSKIIGKIFKCVETESSTYSGMPDRDYQLEERLEALVRFSAPGEEDVGNGFHDFDAPRSPAFLGVRRRKNPRTGGVLFPRDAKASWAVNIRPKNWGNRDKIWLGKLSCMEEAQRIADIIFFYLGSEPAHARFPDPADARPPPPFLDAELRALDSVEKRMRYVKRIAKGDEFQGLRRQLMDGVKEMVKFLTPKQCDDAENNVVEPPVWSARSPPELAVETFDEAYGKRGLNFTFPAFTQEEIESMMNILLPDDDAF